MQRLLFAFGALAGLTAVMMATVVAHALGGLPAVSLQIMRTALQMHGWHALGLLACALWLPRGGRWTAAAGCCFAVGLPLFCAGAYGIGLGWWNVAGAAPAGGTLLMIGWLLLGVGAIAG